MARTYPTAEEFVRAYVTCKTRAEVASKLGIGIDAVSGRVRHYRGAGVNLPLMRRGVQRYDIDVVKLNGIIEEAGMSAGSGEKGEG